MQWQAMSPFYVVSACVNVRKLPIFMLGRDSGDWVIVRFELNIGTNRTHLSAK